MIDTSSREGWGGGRGGGGGGRGDTSLHVDTSPSGNNIRWSRGRHNPDASQLGKHQSEAGDLGQENTRGQPVPARNDGHCHNLGVGTDVIWVCN